MLSTGRRAPRLEANAITGAGGDYDGLLELIGGSSIVLIGEASHGTHEFYRERARITRRLIEEKGFRAVAVEVDWPDAHRVNRYVHGAPEQAYGRAASLGIAESCRREVIAQPIELQHYFRAELGEPPETYPTAL